MIPFALITLTVAVRGPDAWAERLAGRSGRSAARSPAGLPSRTTGGKRGAEKFRADTGTSNTSRASAATKKTCVVIWVISKPLGLGTSNKALYNTTLLSTVGVGSMRPNWLYQRRPSPPSVVKYTFILFCSLLMSASDTCACTVMVDKSAIRNKVGAI